MADSAPICHLQLLMLVIVCILLLDLLLASAQREPTFSPVDAPNDYIMQPPAPLSPQPLFTPVASPAPSPTISFPTLSPAGSPVSFAPTSGVPSPAALFPGLVSPAASSPPSQAQESTHSPPAPPAAKPLILAPPPSLPASVSKGRLSAAQKAGIAVGVLLMVALAGAAGCIIKRRRDNIRRSQYGNQYRGGIL